MKLNERLRQAEATAGRTEDDKPAKDPLDAIRARAQIALFAKVGSRINDATISEEELAMFVADELRKVLDDETAPLTLQERDPLVSECRRDEDRLVVHRQPLGLPGAIGGFDPHCI